MIGVTVAPVTGAPVTGASVTAAVTILAVATAEVGSVAAMIMVAPAPEVVTADLARWRSRPRSRPMVEDAAVGGGGERLNG
jgi:hypothetical protein